MIRTMQLNINFIIKYTHLFCAFLRTTLCKINQHIVSMFNTKNIIGNILHDVCKNDIVSNFHFKFHSYIQ